MKILVLNCGSSSVKYELLEAEDNAILARGEIEAIGSEGTILVYYKGDEKTKFPIIAKDHTTAINEILKVLTSPESGTIKDKNEIAAVGHRIVHGGAYFKEPALVDEDVKKKLDDCIDIAPLHTPHHIKGILAMEALIPEIPQVLVFDTAFHQTMPETAFMYALPYRFYEKYNIRKYGFHGISHQYIAEQVAEISKKPAEKLKIISCHLGNGASVCAIKSGKSIDTSMGFTPLEGLVMGTRTGDMDPSIVTYIMSKELMKPIEAQSLINKQSGLLGVSGVSSDMRIVIKEAENGSARAQLAIDMFCYRVKKYIAAYIGVLDGCDYIVFTAGIGERSPLIRKKILTDMDYFGITIDEKNNSACVSCKGEISGPGSAIKVYVIPANEAGVISKETKKLLDNFGKK